MRIMSLNVRGVGSVPKYNSLEMLFELEKLDTILIHKMMVVGSKAWEVFFNFFRDGNVTQLMLMVFWEAYYQL